MLRTVALSAALISFAAGSPAIAADFFSPVPPPPPPEASLWDGLYFGAHAGYGWGDWDGILTYDPGTGPDYSIWDPPERTIGGSGWLGGGQVGFNKQFGSAVLGLEADAAFSNVTGTGSFSTIGGGYTWDIENKVTAFGTVRGRLGVASNGLLLYATGGLAFARATGSLTVTNELDFPTPVTTALGSATENHIGWTAGAGLEWLFARNWSAKIEYLFADLGRANYRLVGTAYPFPPYQGCGGCVPSPHTTDSFPARLLLQTVRFGVNYHFD